MSLFKKDKTEITEAQKKWNALWDMYGSGELIKTDYNTFALCDYESGINGEGHSGWFYNTENTEGTEATEKIISALKNVLPAHLYENLSKAFDSYGTENEDDVCEAADDHFYEHETEIIDILQAAANRLEL